MELEPDRVRARRGKWWGFEIKWNIELRNVTEAGRRGSVIKRSQLTGVDQTIIRGWWGGTWVQSQRLEEDKDAKRGKK